MLHPSSVLMLVFFLRLNSILSALKRAATMKSQHSEANDQKNNNVRGFNNNKEDKERDGEGERENNDK